MIGKHNFVTILGFLAILAVSVEPANILGYFTSNSPSHQIIHLAYVKALIERGHNVTVVTTTPLKDKNPRYHHIHVLQTEERNQIVANQMKEMKDTPMITTWQQVKFAMKGIISFGGVQYDTVKSKQFQDLMNNPDNKFDLVILGVFFGDYLLGLGEHFKCPVVLSLTSKTNDFIDRYVGNPPEISYTPSLLTNTVRDHTTFMGRLEYFYDRVLLRYLMFNLDTKFAEYYKELFPPSKYAPFEEAAKRVSLVLVNHHLSEGGIRPHVPSVLEVGGIQIKDQPDPLPKDLQEIIDSAKHGVIFLSFGSNLGSKELGEKTIQSLYKAFSSLKQTVLWKWDDTPKPGNAPNIHFMKWLPQDDLLAQPNMKLFITHAGKGSVAEAQFHGVPMVAIPMFTDQPANSKKLVEDGFGVELDKNNLTEELIRSAVLEVLENPKYTNNVQAFSKLYRDRPMTAKQTAMFWIEYVLRHKGAYHMQSPAIHLNAFQYCSLDVIGFLVLVAYIVYKSITVTVKFLFRKLACRLISREQKLKKQ